MTVRTGPPRIAERLLGLLLPDDVREDALGDLADLHNERSTAGGRASADWWYWRQIPHFALRIRMATVVGGSLASPGPRLPDAPPGDTTMQQLLSDLRLK